MGLTEEARTHRPKRPLTYYFKFRGEKLQELKEDQDRTKKINELWNKLSENVKQAENVKFQQEMDEWKVQYEAWRNKYSVTEEDLNDQKQKKKSKKGKHDPEDDPKPAKTKGDGKKEKSVEKVDKSKGKGKEEVKKPTEVQTKNKDKKKK